MGNQESSVEQLNKLIKDTSITAVSKVGTKTSGSAIQSQKLSLTGLKGVSIENVRMAQTLKLSLSSLQDAKTQNDLRSQLATDIMAKLEQHKTDFPKVNYQSNKTKVQNIVEENVNLAFSSEAISEMIVESKQEQELLISNSEGISVSDISLIQDADVIGKQINTMSSTMSAEIATEVGMSSEVKQTDENFIASTFKSIGSMFSSILGGFGDIFSNPVIMIGIIILAVVAGYYFLKKMGLSGNLGGFKGNTITYPPNFNPAGIQMMTPYLNALGRADNIVRDDARNLISSYRAQYPAPLVPQPTPQYPQPYMSYPPSPYPPSPYPPSPYPPSPYPYR